nr:GNAT family N-acetyltransferase [Pedobacter sp. Leaf132]
MGDGRYYAMLADIVVDPDHQGQKIGSYIVNALNAELKDYHFVNLSAAPGADKFYKRWVGKNKLPLTFGLKGRNNLGNIAKIQNKLSAECANHVSQSSITFYFYKCFLIVSCLSSPCH